MKILRGLDRNDTSLAVALVAAALVVFQRPLRVIVDLARLAEAQYNIDLIPGLLVLVGAFGFHQYRKRMQAKAAALAATADATQERARSQELERLVMFGRALGNALDAAALRQILWRYLPPFASNQEIWLLARRDGRWERFLEDATAIGRRSPELLEALATRAMTHQYRPDADAEGFDIGDDVCFPMVAGETAVGVVGVRHQPPLTTAQRRALSAAAALVAIAMRNLQLLDETRECGLRDSLTGCYNRAHALDTVDRELRRAHRTGAPLSVFMFDIDHFKSVNDQYGHLVGDRTLAAVGRLLFRTLRATDVKCRYGGDEFLVVLPDTPISGARQVAEGLLRELAALQVPAVGGEAVTVSASVGLAVALPTETDATTILARADEALYRAKRGGRNQLVVGSREATPA